MFKNLCFSFFKVILVDTLKKSFIHPTILQFQNKFWTPIFQNKFGTKKIALLRSPKFILGVVKNNKVSKQYPQKPQADNQFSQQNECL
jgi:hypothetical protein